VNPTSSSHRLRAAFALLVLAASACALGTTTISIERSALETTASRAPQGDIVIERFTDERPDGQPPYVGAKRNLYGMSLGRLAAPGDEPIEAILTSYVAEALRAAGYRVVDAEADASSRPEGFAPAARLRGQIDEFWVDAYAATCHAVSIRVQLHGPADEVSWEAAFDGEETNVVWLGATSELERIVRRALDQALDDALVAFRSASFRDAVRRAGESARSGESDSITRARP